MPIRYIIGIDEVGRGPLAGPVVVAAVCIPLILKTDKSLGSFKDSKQLSVSAREGWSKYLRAAKDVKFAITRVNSKGIDRLNISAAANRAAEKALMQLKKKYGINLQRCTILLDGGLYIKSKMHQKIYKAKTFPKADEKVPAVAFASIIAKVHRDRYMTKQAKAYPQYGFEEHKGYGTLRHRRALKRYGRSPLHRLTFTKGDSRMLRTN